MDQHETPTAGSGKLASQGDGTSFLGHQGGGCGWSGQEDDQLQKSFTCDPSGFKNTQNCRSNIRWLTSEEYAAVITQGT